jgi:hypothetical protein
LQIDCGLKAASRTKSGFTSPAVDPKPDGRRPPLCGSVECSVPNCGCGSFDVPATRVSCPAIQILADRAAEAETLSLDPRYPKYFTSAVHLPTGWL